MKTAGMIGGLGPESTIDYYRSIIARYRVRNPDGSYPSLIINKYLNELLNGIFLPETREELLRIARRMKVEEGTEAMILAGTELPLLLRDSESADIEFLDTTEIHVEVIVDGLLR